MSEWSVLHWKKCSRSVLGEKNQVKNCNPSAGQSLPSCLLCCKTRPLRNYARGLMTYNLVLPQSPVQACVFC